MISLTPVTDKTAMKFRYEQAKKEEGVIEEENIVRTEFGLNTHVLLVIIHDE